MKSNRRLTTIVAAFAALPFIYGGCVVVFTSGDVDDDKDKEKASVVVAAPAAIGPENAAEFAIGALTGGLTSDGPTNPAPAEAPAHSRAKTFRTLRLPVSLAGALQHIQPDPAAVRYSLSGFLEESGAVAGGCGGRFVYKLDLDRGSERFNGSLDFEDYCEDGFTLRAQTRVDGWFDPSSGTIVSARFVFEDLDTGDLSYAGEMQLDISGDLIGAFLNADAVESASGKVHRLSAYDIEITRHAGFFEMAAVGTYGHPDYGEVDLETTAPFVIHREDRWPASGGSVVSGENATAAALTAVDHLRFRVYADTDGSGRFDRNAGTHPWPEAGDQ